MTWLLYDAGLKVPDDVTIVWVDDNFGYLRRLGKPEERKRAARAVTLQPASSSYAWKVGAPAAPALDVPLPALSPGKHVFTIRAVDPGAVSDRVSLPGRRR